MTRPQTSNEEGSAPAAATTAVAAINSDPDTQLREFSKIMQLTKDIKDESFAPYLPLLFRLNGKPYDLGSRFPMEPLFTTKLPWRMLYKCGRQTSKSTSVAAQGVVQSACIPYFRTLYVLPLFEMTRRFSSNYVRPFIDQSPVKRLFQDTQCEKSVLQKTFRNHSIMFFTFAFMDCTRVRGVAADRVVIDEVQDMQWDFVPIIEQTLKASEWNLRQYTGTPKTFDNTIQALWDDSSQAEWVTQCKACGHYNIASVEFDLLKMLGPVDNIEKYGTALRCGKCMKPMHAGHGCWVHRYPERSVEFPGYHVPQPVLPMHYTSEMMWIDLLKTRDHDAESVFLNECLGESCDTGTKLVTISELRAASVLHKNDLDVARNLDFTKGYIQRIIGVDWGGGGREEVSYTTIAVVGLRPDYRQELIYGERLNTATGHVEEVRRILELFQLFQCHFLAHDYGGSGSVHETLILQAGFPHSKVIPFSYVGASAKNLINHHPMNQNHSRHYYSLNKTWSLLILCTMLKTKHLLLPEYESAKNLTEDFLHLIEHKTESMRSGDLMAVIRQPKQSDDMVHAINFAACGHFHSTQHYPDMASSFSLTLTPEQREVAQPPEFLAVEDWEDWTEAPV